MDQEETIIDRLRKTRYTKLLSIFVFIFGFACILLYYLSVNNTSSFLSNKVQFLTGLRFKLNKSDKVYLPNITELKEVYFSDNDLSPKQLLKVNSNVSYTPYLDMKFAGDCGVPYGRDALFKLMQGWIKITALYKIPWWLTFGSLIGALRHKDMVPWDSDIDLAIPAQFEPLIRNISTARKDISLSKINIVVRPGPHCPYNGPRLDCSGNSVTSHVDGCAFCGPLARVFYSSNKRIDIYLYDFRFKDGRFMVLDEGFFEYSLEAPAHNADYFLPLRNCSFMGLTVQCPRKSEKYINKMYGDFESKYECRKGEWFKL